MNADYATRRDLNLLQGTSRSDQRGAALDLFGWRKRRDGFEWRDYVRTTILVRRKRRHERIEDARKAAIDGLARARERGAEIGRSGAIAAQRGLSKASRRAGGFGRSAAHWAYHQARNAGAAIGPMAIRAANAVASTGIAVGGFAWRAARKAGALLVRAARQGGARAMTLFADAGAMLLPRLRRIANRQTAMPLAMVGGAAAIGAAGVIASQGLSFTAILAALAAAGLLLLSALAFADAGMLRWPKQLVALLPSSPRARAIGVGACFAGMLAISLPLGWTSLRPSLNVANIIPDLFGANEVVAGYAVSLTGDTMRIDGKIVRLADVEAPELTQTCTRSGGGSWNCGEAALKALRRLTGRNTITCEVRSTDTSGRKLARCRVGEMDLAAELVRKGYVFASGSLFAAYGSEQAEAQAAKAGLWGGMAKRPQEYRNERWEAASRVAPNGCPIKGRVLAGDKVYLLPWSRSYETYRVRESRGDRWLCDEGDALREGWKPFDS